MIFRKINLDNVDYDATVDLEEIIKLIFIDSNWFWVLPPLAAIIRKVHTRFLL